MSNGRTTHLVDALATLYNVCRPYSIPYIAGLGTVGALSSVSAPNPSQLILAAVIGPVLWTLCLFANDWAHRKADALTRPDRGSRFERLPVSMVLLVLTCVGLVSQLRPPSILLAIGIVVSAVVYGLNKSHPGAALTFRGLCGALLVLLGASIVSPGALPQSVYFPAAMFGFADATGNLLGDVRDRDNDRRAGTSTLPVRSSHWPLVSQAIHLTSMVMVLFSFSAHRSVCVALLVGGLGVLGLAKSGEFYSHLGYLLWKYVLISASFSVYDYPLMALITTGTIVFATNSYNQSHRRPEPRPSETLPPEVRRRVGELPIPALEEAGIGPEGHWRTGRDSNPRHAD